MDPNGSVNQLLSALGADSTQGELLRFNQQHEARKLEEQKVKFDGYVEQFMRDKADGAVSQAQVKARFPETVPVIASRIAEAVGQQEGKKQFQSVIDEIAGSDSLRLDSTARAKFLQDKRAELMGGIGEGNDFYASGVVASMDRLIAQHEANWQGETAAYHQKVQAEQFSGEVVDAFNSGDPKKLLDLDAKFAASSSLNPLERKKLVVDSAIDLAFVNDDLEILKAVPVEFLTVDHRAALEKAKVQLTDRRMKAQRDADDIRKAKRAEDERNMKLEIIRDVVEGRTVDPAKYRHSDVGFQYALQMREVRRLDDSESIAEAARIRNRVLTQSTVGETRLNDLIMDAASNPGLNPKERQSLIEELPKLVEGRNLMRDDDVRQPINDRLNPRLQALESSTNQTVQAMLTGRNLRAEVMRGYDRDIRASFMAEFEETGNWPTGHRKLELIDKALDRAERRLEDATRLGKEHATGGSESAPLPTPKATARPSATMGPNGLPTGVTRLP